MNELVKTKEINNSDISYLDVQIADRLTRIKTLRCIQCLYLYLLH